MFSYDGRGSTATLERIAPEERSQLISQWQTPPPWGGSWGDFFALFQQSAARGQPGAQISELYHWAHGDVHATVPQIRGALQDAIEAGIVVPVKDETPAGTHEYYLLQHSWLLDAIMSARGQEADCVRFNDTAVNTIRELDSFSFDSCAKRHGFDGGSTLSAAKVIEFFSEGPYSATEIYKSQRLYHDGVWFFSPALRAFIDEVVQQGIQSGVITVTKNDEGREMYGLAREVTQLELLRESQAA